MEKNNLDRCFSVAFPICCYRNIISARSKLPQEAGFIWWFRFNYLLSSTIWNQCSWRKNACVRQWNSSLETVVEKKRSKCASAIRVSSTTNQMTSGGWDLWVYGLWESITRGRNSGVILLGSSMFTAFVGDEPELGNREGLTRHKHCKKNVIWNCNTASRHWW